MTKLDIKCQAFAEDMVDKAAAARDWLSKNDAAEFAVSLFEDALQKQKPSVADKFLEFVINGMISGVGTPIANIASNMAQVVIQPVLTSAQALTSSVTGNNKKTFREAGAMLQALMDGWIADIPMFTKGFKTGRPMDFIPTAKDLGMTEKAFKEKLVKAGVATDAEGNIDKQAFAKLVDESYDYMTNKIKGPLGEIIRVPTKVTVGIDEYFKARLRKQQIFALASQKASKDAAEGLGSYSELYNKYRKAAYSDPLQWQKSVEKVFGEDDNFATAVFDVRNFAKVNTFQQRLSGVPAHLQRLRNSHPTFTYIIPFLRTPWNIVKEGSSYVPGLPLALRPTTIRTVAKEVAGKADKVLTEEVIKMPIEEVMARQLVGASIIATLYGMFEAGQITGAYPDDEKEKQNWINTGKQPFSIKLGDQWYNYGRLEPLSTSIGVFADLRKATNDIKEQGLEANEAAIEMLKSLHRSLKANILQKSFVEGFASLVDAANDENQIPAFIDSMLRPLVPAIVNQAARISDPYEREATTHWERLKQRIPLLREELPKRFKDYGGAAETNLPQAITSFAVSQPQTQLQKDMERIGASLGKMDRKVQGVELTTEQYARMKELANKFTTQLIEQTAKKMQGKAIEVKVLETMMQRGRQIAQDQILAEVLKDPKQREEWLKKKRESRGLEPNEVDKKDAKAWAVLQRMKIKDPNLNVDYMWDAYKNASPEKKQAMWKQMGVD